jgi:hypothetical protein
MTFETLVGLATIVSAIVGVLAFRIMHRQGNRQKSDDSPKQFVTSSVLVNVEIGAEPKRRSTHTHALSNTWPNLLKKLFHSHKVAKFDKLTDGFHYGINIKSPDAYREFLEGIDDTKIFDEFFRSYIGGEEFPTAKGVRLAKDIRVIGDVIRADAGWVDANQAAHSLWGAIRNFRATRTIVRNPEAAEHIGVAFLSLLDRLPEQKRKEIVDYFNGNGVGVLNDMMRAADSSVADGIQAHIYSISG